MERRDDSDDPGSRNGLEGFNFDRDTERAWRRFESRLALRLVDLGGDDSPLVIDVEVSDADEIGPYVQLCGDDAGNVHLEASSNYHLTGRYRLSAEAEAALGQIGFTSPAPEAPGGLTNFAFDADQLQCDRLANMAVRALREVFGVPHPAFLGAKGLFVTAGASDADPSLDVTMCPVVPRDRPHLMSLVADALTPVLGEVPELDEDGDIPVVTGGSLVFVRVMADHPTIELFASVVSDIDDMDRAVFEIGVLNRDSRYLRYVLAGDRILAYLDIPAYPFIPHHLVGLLATMAETIDRVDDDLAVRLSALRSRGVVSEDEDDDDEVPGEPELPVRLPYRRPRRPAEPRLPFDECDHLGEEHSE